jgi:ABC-type nickel/cobalt efflux system permease component RcnA
MLELLSLVGLGFFLGMRHATDPDHVIAVTTIVSRERSVWAAVLVGALWGIGHTATVVAVGSAILLLGLVIPPRLGLTMEFSVALMLVLLGILNLTGLMQLIRHRLARPTPTAAMHSHPHAHGDYVHDHVHGHAGGDHGDAEDSTPQARLDRQLSRLTPYQVLPPLAVGLVHGLAGSAAVALLVLATIHHVAWAAVYLALFGLGTIVGMMLITTAISLPFAYSSGRFVGLNRHLGVAAGVVSLAFGLFLIYQIGVVDGLFSEHPSWTPK